MLWRGASGLCLGFIQEPPHIVTTRPGATNEGNTEDHGIPTGPSGGWGWGGKEQWKDAPSLPILSRLITPRHDSFCYFPFHSLSMLFFAFMEKSLIFYACNLTCSRHNTPLFTSINWDSTCSLEIRDITPCLWLVDTECTGVVYRAIRRGKILIPSCWRAIRGEHEPLCSPSPAMVTCLFEWKILERNPGEGVLSFFRTCALSFCRKIMQ